MRWQIYGRLGWLETKRRYRRTLIGPFWSAVSLAIFVAALGSVGVGLWNQSAADYVPFLAAGLIVWILIQTIVTESCVLFIQQINLLRQMRLEYSIFAYTLVWRNLIAFAHNLIVYVVATLIFSPQRFGPALLLAPIGLALVVVNAAWIALFLGMVCLRFRDVQQLVGNVIQVAIFVTPIFWPAELLKSTNRIIFVTLNPIYHLIEVVRAPLVGKVPTLESYVGVVIIALVGWMLTYVLFRRYRHRIPYWS